MKKQNFITLILIELFFFQSAQAQSTDNNAGRLSVINEYGPLLHNTVGFTGVLL